MSQWDDKSGNGNHATQGTGAYQPITGTRNVGGLNGIDFDGIDDVLLLPSGINTINIGDNTIISVFATDSLIKDQRIYSGNDSSDPNSSRLMTRLNYAAPSVDHRSTATNETTAIAVTPDTSPHINTAVKTGVALSARYDGGAESIGAASNKTLSNVKIGASPSGTVAQYDGLLLELIMFSRALTNAEMNQVGNYLAAKWGITWAGI